MRQRQRDRKREREGGRRKRDWEREGGRGERKGEEGRIAFYSTHLSISWTAPHHWAVGEIKL